MILLTGTPATATDKVLGTVVFILLVAFILLTFFDIVSRFFNWLGNRKAAPDSVNVTLNQMYGDIHTQNAKMQSDREFFDVAATEAMRRHYQGGGNG